MPKYLFDQKQAKADLQGFFKKEKANLDSFGSAVNQTFEAFVFAKVIEKFRDLGYSVSIHNPNLGKTRPFRLKFSTRGAPKNYTYVVVQKDEHIYQIRHQLRVSTAKEKAKRRYNANVCCDIAIIQDEDLSLLKSDDSIPNEWLVSFCEVKHMSAFAELIASFIGLAHELQPQRLKRLRIKNYQPDGIPSFLYVSGFLNPTAKGIRETIKNRKYDIDIYSFEKPIVSKKDSQDP